jgi:hypothetical protein
MFFFWIYNVQADGPEVYVALQMRAHLILQARRVLVLAVPSYLCSMSKWSYEAYVLDRHQQLGRTFSKLYHLHAWGWRILIKLPRPTWGSPNCIVAHATWLVV